MFLICLLFVLLFLSRIKVEEGICYTHFKRKKNGEGFVSKKGGRYYGKIEI